MSILVIGDKNSILGFGLVGVAGRTVQSLAEAEAALDEMVGQQEVEIILITEPWATQMADKINHLKMASAQPVILEIPGSEPSPAGKSLRQLVQEAVGISLGG
jgi:V/A-type H+-transporting ATPase subunit F